MAQANESNKKHYSESSWQFPKKKKENKKINSFPFYSYTNAVSEYLSVTSQRYIQNPLPTVTHHIIPSDLTLFYSFE